MVSKKDVFGDETMDVQNDFGALLEQSMRGMGRGVKVGDTFKGEILSIGKEECFVSTGTPADGMIHKSELLDENKVLKYKVGDLVEVVVLKINNGEIALRLKGSKAVADLDSLEDAFDMEVPVEGKVIEVVKGGFKVSLMGKTAFCPLSQIDLRVSTDQNQYVGNKYEFIVTKFEKSARDIVVSRRRWLEVNKAEAEGEFIEKHAVDDIVEGTVSRLDTFGAFVELASGVEGLVHISEISWSRLAHPSEMLQIGAPVRVKILKMEEDDTNRLRISLSIKQGGGEADPWILATQKYPVGSVVEGSVVKKETFGLFVNVAPGLQGLLPKSKWRDSAEVSTFENKKRGDSIKVRIDEIQVEARRISLGIPGDDSDETWRAHNVSSTGKGLGTFADLLQGVKTKK
jgi:small subunit ribosomal protein S1